MRRCSAKTNKSALSGSLPWPCTAAVAAAAVEGAALAVAPRAAATSALGTSGRTAAEVVVVRGNYLCSCDRIVFFLFVVIVGDRLATNEFVLLRWDRMVSCFVLFCCVIFFGGGCNNIPVVVVTAGDDFDFDTAVKTVLVGARPPRLCR